MVLDELGALLLDQDRAGAEVGVVVVGDLGDDRLDRLGLDAGLSGVVDTARQVAVGETSMVGAKAGDTSQSSQVGDLVRCDTTPREQAVESGPTRMGGALRDGRRARSIDDPDAA